MANIMDVINKYRSKTAEAAPDTGESYGAGGAGTVRQNVGMQSAQAAQARALIKGAGENTFEASMLEEQRKQANVQRDSQIVEMGQQSRAEKQQYQMKADASMNYLTTNMDKLETAERMDQMEASATYLRLQDEKYRYELADVGNRLRLDNKSSFDTALQRAIFADSEELLKNDLQFQYALTVNDAEFRKYLSTIDANMAINMSNTQIKSASETAMISAAGSVAEGIVSMKMQKDKDKVKK